VVLSTRRPGAVLEVGEDCGFTGTTLVAADRITIGDRVLVGGNASIVDFDFHPRPRAAPRPSTLGPPRTS